MNISLLYNVFLGETSPLIAARIDSPAYEMGARRMENFIPMLTGGIRKRPGTVFDGNTHMGVSKARLIEWLLSDGTCLLLELTGGLIMVRRIDEEGKVNYIHPYITADYSTPMLPGIQYAASKDSMWLVHADCAVLKLTWNGTAVIKSTPKFYKEIDLNAPSGIQECSPCNGSGFISRDQPCNTCNNTGKNKCPICSERRLRMVRKPQTPDYFEFTTPADQGYGILSGNFTINSNGISIIFSPSQIAPAVLYGEYVTGLNTIALFPVDIDITADDKSVLKRWAGEYKRDGGDGYTYIDTKGSGLKKCLVCSGTGSANTGACKYCQGQGVINCGTCNATGRTTCSICNGIGSIDNICDDCKGTGRIDIKPDIEKEYMFDAKDNYPSCIAFNAGRLFLAGTKSEPNRIYASRAPNSITGEDRYTDFTPGSNPADSIVIEKNDMHGSRIQWIAANRHFLAATEKATWSDTGDIPTPATFDMNIIEYTGAHRIQSRGTREIMVYAGRGGKTLRALVWNQSAQGSGFIDIDISQQAAHLFTSGIKDFAVSDFPYPMIWIVTNEGDLISCTISIREGITAFARHKTDGIFEAIAVLPHKTRDYIFFVIERDGKRQVEHLTLDDLVNTDFADSHYVDAGQQTTFDKPTNVVTGLYHLAGKKINVFADGAIEPPVQVDENGNAELKTKVSNVRIGLPYTSYFAPNERQIPANGTSLGKKRRIEKITIRAHRSLGGKAGTSEEKAIALITQKYGEYILGSAPEPFTGEIDITVSGNIDTEGRLVILHEEPAPFTMLALVERVAVMEA